MKMKKFIALCLSLVAALGMSLAVASCGATQDSTSGTQNSVPEGMVKFEFTVKIDGTLAANAMVILCQGEENCTSYFTDTNGYVTMTVEDQAGWEAHVAGYEGEAYAQYVFHADEEESNSFVFDLPSK